MTEFSAGDGHAAPYFPWLRAWAPRFVLAYVLVYMAPFPLTLLGYLLRIPYAADVPGLAAVLGFVMGAHGLIVTPIVAWTGATVFGVEALATFTGSGDTTFAYLDLLVDLFLALTLSLGWVVAAGRKRVAPRTFDVAYTLARFYLATTMLSYGWIKTFPLQFSLPGPDRLIQPYGDSSPMGLAWTFLGASIGYQMFAGLSELLGGYLLFWRRTALLGALVSAAVMTNVMAINFFYDVPVKLFSAHLVLVAVFIAAPDLRRLADLFIWHRRVEPRPTTPFWRKGPARRRRILVVHTIFVVALTAAHVTSNLTASRSRGVLAEPDPLLGVYRVESFVQDGLADRDNDDDARWVRLGLNQFTATVQRASGDAIRMRVQLDRDAATLSLFDRGARPPNEPMFRYVDTEPDVLRLEGTFEGKPTLVVLRKDAEGALLTERGFHWINEYPFNR